MAGWPNGKALDYDPLFLTNQDAWHQEIAGSTPASVIFWIRVGKEMACDMSVCSFFCFSGIQ